jgi:hypothetical protein
MTFTSKLAQLRAAVEAYNASLPANEEAINLTHVEAKLEKMGARTEETLAFMSWDDLQDAGLPKLLAKQVASLLRGESKGDQAEHISAKKADRLTFDELFKAYVPTEDNHVAKKLKELSGNKRCVVFLPGGTKVDVAASTALLQDLRRGFPEISVVNGMGSSGKPVPIFRVGEVPNDEADENPIYAGRPLRSGETCDQTLRSWSGISHEVRQLVRLALDKTGEARAANVQDAHNLIDLCLQPVAGEKLRARFPRASVLLDELAAKNEAPRLKVKPQGAATNGDPFYRR